MPNLSPFHRRRIAVIASVLLLHLLALWALQTGLLQRMVVNVEELVLPVSVITEPPALAKPAPVPPALPPPRTTKAPALPATAPAPAPAAAAPALPAIADNSPAAAAPTAVQRATPVAAAPVATGAPTARVELPSSEADYLQNPPPKYPGLSKSRNEQGTVRLSVLIGTDGRAKEVKIKVSSGFERLDRAARDAVLGWTFVPGKRAGVPEEMWYDLAMPFRLTE